MFRFEVHVRITDETGQHIQHMSTAANPPESFLFSSLFDGDGGVMVGGSGPLSNFCADDPLSGKSPTELCCGLVDDFVSRTSGKDDAIFVGHQSSWKMGFPGDWNIFVSSNDGSSSGDACHRSSERVSSEEERSSQWSSEEDQNLVEFHNEETKALWESLSRSSDPYNPFFFSACITTNNSMGKKDHRETDLRSVSTAGELLGPTGLKMWVSRSDSESSWSSSDGSSANMDEETERLLEFFSSPDPYNPMCFSACSVTENAAVGEQQASLPAPPPRPDADAEETENSPPPSSEDEEEEQVWKSLCSKDDPYHPFNFQARLHSSPKTPAQLPASSHHTTNPPTKGGNSENSRTSKPSPPVRRLKHRCHPDQTLVPWKRPGQAKRTDRNQSSAQKKVIIQSQVKTVRQAEIRGKYCRKDSLCRMLRHNIGVMLLATPAVAMTEPVM